MWLVHVGTSLFARSMMNDPEREMSTGSFELQTAMRDDNEKEEEEEE